MQIGHQISFTSSDLTEEKITDDIPDELKEYTDELSDALIKFKERCCIKQLYIYPNFQYRWLAPSTGYVATFDPDDRFRNGAFNTERFRSFTMIKLKLTTGDLTEEKISFIEERIKKCLPQVSICPPTIDSISDDGWGCSLGQRGCSIGIYKTTVEHLKDGSSEDMYYLICHSSLPDQLIGQLHENDDNIQRSVDDFILKRGIVRTERLQKAEPLTFGEEITDEDKGSMMRIKRVAMENPKRLMYYYSRLAEIELDIDVLLDGEGESILDEPTIAVKLEELHSWYKKWPKGALIQPFSMIENYPIGKAAAMLPDEDRDKMGMVFDQSVVSFTPDCQTLYNTFHSEGSSITYYNHTTRQEGCWLVHKGLELGYDCYNYDPIKRQPLQNDKKISNMDFGKGWPVIYRFKPDPLRRLQQDTLRKFYPSNDQLKGKFCYPPPEEIAQIEEDLGAKKKISFQPIHVFLSDKTADTNIALYNI